MRAFGRWRTVASTAAVAVVVSGLSVLVPNSAAAQPAHDPAVLGTSSDTAAGSCWEIKQHRPSAANGAYWLLTSQMPAPQQFYCDMTTDGGGWVLVGKGRNGWIENQTGTGSPAALLDTGFAGGADTHQLPADLIDQLLGGGKVTDLTSGVRLRRAVDASGLLWQEVRYRTRSIGDDKWTWAIGGGLPLQSYSFNGLLVNSSQTTKDFGIDSSFNRVNPQRRSQNNYDLGFAYGTNVVGTSSFGSYLYSPNQSGRALPFTLVYLRPQVTSAAGFATIPDGGTVAVEQRALPKSEADRMPWGVTGVAGSADREGSVEVQAFVEAAGRMYVGGNFRYVQQGSGGTGRVEQPFLAAFDLETGAWVSSFRPNLNEQVRALEVLPSGAIVAAGEFSAANGAPATAIVALDPDTGATDPSFELTIENRLAGGVLRVNSLAVNGEHLYLGGAFTHLKGGGRSWFAYMRGAGRVLASDGTTQTGWNPEFNGTVISVDGTADASRLYAAGFFTKSQGTAARRAAAVQTAEGAPLAQPAWNPVWSNSKDYQQAIRSEGDRVWVGGSEHSLFSFSTSTFARTSTSIMNFHGDLQAIEIDESGVAYGGCHCNEFTYEGAANWPSPKGWHSVYSMNWVGAWDNATGNRLPVFSPRLSTRLGSGAWAVASDSNGRLWVGGDFVTARTASGPGTWTGGFVRFSPRDTSAPATPNGLKVVANDGESVTLTWNAVTDPSGVHYQVLRGDRTIAVTGGTTLTVPAGNSSRYFVRAADAAGNISASTPVLEAGDPVEPPPPPVELVGLDAVWSWHYEDGAPGEGWNDVGFDASGWQAGQGRLGWGSDGIVTDIDTFEDTQDRPRAAFFRYEFSVADPGEFASLDITGLADDGAIFYVNGVEVARQNMEDREGTHMTFAASARRVWVAEADPVVVSVPAGLLVAGTNVAAASTHVGFRGTKDLTFELEALGMRTTP